MGTNKMRAEFEAAYKIRSTARNGRFYPGVLTRDESGDYVIPQVQCAWWGWQTSRPTSWQPMESCPKHVEVLFYRKDCGVISGQVTCADTFMTDKERDSGEYSEEEQYSEDAWCYGPDGVERLDGDLVPTHWMPYPDEPEVTP